MVPSPIRLNVKMHCHYKKNHKIRHSKAKRKSSKDEESEEETDFIDVNIMYIIISHLILGIFHVQKQMK